MSVFRCAGDEWRKGKVLGRGSFGEAFIVSSIKDPSRLAVVKLVNISAMSARERRDANNEVIVLSKLQHPNIVGFIGSFETRGMLYILMDYCNAGDLEGLVKRQKSVPFPEETIASILVQTATGIRYLHERRIMHRDLKSQNIFLHRQSNLSPMIAKLGDFGISTILKSTLALAKTVCGTPYYFSPELCLNRPYNNKSDIWSLGIILYELATLKHAFQGSSMHELMRRILLGRYDPVPLQYHPSLSDLIANMLLQKVDGRYDARKVLSSEFVQRHIEIMGVKQGYSSTTFQHNPYHNRCLKDQQKYIDKPDQYVMKVENKKDQREGLEDKTDKTNNDINQRNKEKNMNQQKQRVWSELSPRELAIIYKNRVNYDAPWNLGRDSPNGYKKRSLDKHQLVRGRVEGKFDEIPTGCPLPIRRKPIINQMHQPLVDPSQVNYIGTGTVVTETDIDNILKKEKDDVRETYNGSVGNIMEGHGEESGQYAWLEYKRKIREAEGLDPNREFTDAELRLLEPKKHPDKRKKMHEAMNDKDKPQQQRHCLLRESKRAKRQYIPVRNIVRVLHDSSEERISSGEGDECGTNEHLPVERNNNLPPMSTLTYQARKSYPYICEGDVYDENFNKVMSAINEQPNARSPTPEMFGDEGWDKFSEEEEKIRQLYCREEACSLSPVVSAILPSIL